MIRFTVTLLPFLAVGCSLPWGEAGHKTFDYARENVPEDPTSWFQWIMYGLGGVGVFATAILGKTAKDTRDTKKKIEEIDKAVKANGKK